MFKYKVCYNLPMKNTLLKDKYTATKVASRNRRPATKVYISKDEVMGALKKAYKSHQDRVTFVS